VCDQSRSFEYRHRFVDPSRFGSRIRFEDGTFATDGLFPGKQGRAASLAAVKGTSPQSRLDQVTAILDELDLTRGQIIDIDTGTALQCKIWNSLHQWFQHIGTGQHLWVGMSATPVEATIGVDVCR
jgi:hypothetical protein